MKKKAKENLNDALSLLGFLAGDQLQQKIHEGRGSDVLQNFAKGVLTGLNELNGLRKIKFGK